MSDPPISKIPKPWPGFRSISRAEYILSWSVLNKRELRDCCTQPHIGQMWKAESNSRHRRAGITSCLPEPQLIVIPWLYLVSNNLLKLSLPSFNTLFNTDAHIPTKWPTFVREQSSKFVLELWSYLLPTHLLQGSFSCRYFESTVTPSGPTPYKL